MRVLITADWQARLSNLDRCEQVVTEICEINRKRAVDFVVHLGDWGDAFNPRDVRVTNFLIDAVRTIKNTTKDRLLITLLGNHDRSGPQDHLPSIFPVLESAGAQTIEVPHHYNIGAGWFAYFVPYIRDQEKLKKALDAPGDRYNRILFFHAGLCNSKLSVLRKDTDSLENKMFHPERYRTCIGGHHHFQQQIPPNFWYVGSPFAQDWSECNQPNKGYLLLTLDTEAKVEPIASKIPLWWDVDFPGWDRKHAAKESSRIRVRIPFEDAGQFAVQSKTMQAKFPKAALHIIPVYKNQITPVMGHLSLDSDAELIQAFIKHNPTLVRKPEAAVAYLVSRLKASGSGDVFQLRDLKLKSCHAEDVLGFNMVDFKIDHPGMTLVTGDNRDWGNHSNGSGKSSFLSLPVIALFGATPKGQDFNGWMRRGQKKAVIQLYAEMDGKKVLIDRRRPSGLQLMVDGKSFDMGDSHATQRMIDQLTGLTWDVLVNSLYVTQNEIGTLLTGTDKMRQNLFSRFLGLDRFIKALELVRKDLNRLKDRIAETESMVFESAERVTAQQQALDAINIKDIITGPEYHKEANRIKTLIEQSHSEQAEAELTKKSWIAKKTKVLEQKYTLVHENSATITKIESIEEDIAQIQDLERETLCPTCGAKVNRAHLVKHVKALRQEQAEQEIIIDALENKRAALEKRIKGIEAKINYLDSFMLNRRLEREKLRTEFKVLGEKRQHAQQMETLHRLGTKELNRWQQRLEAHKACVEVLQEDWNFLNDCLAVVSRSGLPAFICSTACPRLNASAMEFSDALAEQEIQVQFAVVDGSIDVSVVNAHGGEHVEDQSGGELKIAALITALSLRDALVPFNCLILDEPCEGLDPENARAFARALNQLKKRFGSVLIVTHNTNALAELEPDRHLEIVKEGGIARVYDRTYRTN